MFCSPMIRSQLVSLCFWNVNLTNASQLLFSLQMGQEGLKKLELGISLPPGKLDSDKSPTG